jgi:hypothetical protein
MRKRDHSGVEWHPSGGMRTRGFALDSQRCGSENVFDPNTHAVRSIAFTDGQIRCWAVTNARALCSAGPVAEDHLEEEGARGDSDDWNSKMLRLPIVGPLVCVSPFSPDSMSRGVLFPDSSGHTVPTPSNAERNYGFRPLSPTFCTTIKSEMPILGQEPLCQRVLGFLVAILGFARCKLSIIPNSFNSRRASTPAFIVIHISTRMLFSWDEM